MNGADDSIENLKSEILAKNEQIIFLEKKLIK
jgi:hypothetical protein